MTIKICVCQFCREPLEPVQELRYLVEVQSLAEPETLKRLRQLPDVNGKPLRVCKACHGSIDADPVGFRSAVARAHSRVRQNQRRQRSGLLTALGVLSISWMFASLLGVRAD